MSRPDRPSPERGAAERRGYAAEAGHFYLCGRCGQYVDRRSPEQVSHHQRLSHKAIRQG